MNLARFPSDALTSVICADIQAVYAGKRLSLVALGEETTPEKIKELRRCTALGISEEDSKYLVHFHIEGVRPLLGSE
jgi:hypothetical protein